MNFTRKRFLLSGVRRIITSVTAMILLVAAFSLPCVEAEGSGCAVICSNLNLRTGASTGFKVLMQLPLGSKVLALYESGDWTKVDVNGQQGWVYTDYIKKHYDPYAEKNPTLSRYVVLDISQYQGDINWDALSKEGLYGVILRLGLYSVSLGRNRVDDKVNEYYHEAKKHDLKVGMYFYSVATNEERANNEAAFVLNTIKSYDWKLDLPFYYDAESSLMRNKGAANIRSYTDIFCKTLEKAGFYTGIYASTSWIQDYYEGYTVLNDRSIWVADYRGYCGYTENHDMWQYSSSALVSGITEGTADINVLYRDLAKYIIDNGFNNYSVGALDNTSETELNSEETIEGYLFGDADLDGKITAEDARQTLRISAKLEYPLEISLILSDADCDGNITAEDARTILRVSAKLDKMPKYKSLKTDELSSSEGVSV